MNALLPTLLDWLQQIGYPVLGMTVFVAAAGMPLPTSLLLLASGAFAAVGDFNLALLLLIAISASVCGDNLGYWIGRLWGTKVLNWLERPRRRSLISPRIVERARREFVQHGGWAVFLSRFLFSALGGVINLLAGADLYPYRRFLVFDAFGEALGEGIPIVLGYAFAASWQEVGDLLGAFSSLILVLLVMIGLTIYLIRLIRHVRASRAAAKEAQEKPMEVGEIVMPQVKADRSPSGNLPP
jgi:membrane-associated protein